MKGDMDRRGFLKTSLAASMGAAFGLSAAGTASSSESSGPGERTGKKGMPLGRIGDLTVGRLISGGNLISGWSHSRDLIYVHQLMRHYNTDEKVMDTLELLEENGVNALLADPNGKTLRIFTRYWNERGGSIQWISDTRPEPGDLDTNIKAAIDNGASAVYVNGGWSDNWHLDGRTELLGRSVEAIKRHGVPAGIGGHSLDTIIACETGGFDPDFYVKTLHHHDYWSARPSEMDRPVARNPSDNYWARTPEQTIQYMRQVDRPWIAFKVLAAGAIHPSDGFRYAFEGGADFICVGMFDWQVEQDAQIARRTITQVARGGRRRAWHG